MALTELEELQIADFEGIFRAIDGRPVVIRLPDPPLHEFLPRYEEVLAEVIKLRGESDRSGELERQEALLGAVGGMREANLMLGLRECRVGLTYPAIYQMQTRAILRAAYNVTADGVRALPEIMVPLVSHANEMKLVRGHLVATMQEFSQEVGSAVSYRIGTMIETPRAALTASEAGFSGRDGTAATRRGRGHRTLL